MTVPQNLHFGGGSSETVLHPLVLLGMLTAIPLILSLPRRKVIVPFLLIVFLTPAGQQIYCGVHMQVLHIVIVAGCIRLLIDSFTKGSEIIPGGVNGIDRAFAIVSCCLALAPIILFHTMAAVPTQTALALQAFGGYFFLRYLIQDEQDIAKAVQVFALLTAVLGLCMANERFMHTNVFGYLHSLPISPIVRSGTVRAEAAFAHPILAGCFGATLLPLFFWLKKTGKANGIAMLGMVGSVLMVFCCASSTPALALVGGVFALCLWPIRRQMRLLRWGMVLAVVALQVTMKAPVWFLIARVHVTGASDAYDRAALVDTFIRHFSDWWLIGADPSGWGWDMWDLSNQFVGVGESGGLLAIVFFILLLWRCFSKLGKTRREVHGDKKLEWLCWSLGAVFFAHILCYFGVSYFDQTAIVWYASLAMVSAAAASVNKKVAKTAVPTKVKIADETETEPVPAWLAQDARDAQFASYPWSKATLSY